MRQETVQFFTDKEDEIVVLLTKIGMQISVARVLIFFATKPEATSKDIERRTDLHQTQISVAMRYLIERGWIKICMISKGSKGRPVKVYGRVKSIREIMQVIEKEKKKEAKEQLAIVKKIKDTVG